MPGLIERARQALARRIAPRAPRPQDDPRAARRRDDPPGGFSFGTGTWYGGPVYTDAFGTRRGPSPWALVEKHKGLIYALAARNCNGVTRLPLRLYADGSRAQGMPTRWCDPIRVSRSIAGRFARAGLVSAAAVDRVYELRTHPFLDLLDNADGEHYYTRRQLLGLMVGYMDVVGSGFLVPDGGGWDWTRGIVGAGVPERLWVVYPQYVLPIRYPNSPRVQFWQYFADRIPFGSMLWFRQGLSLRDPYGASYSPTYAGDMYQDQEARFIAIYDQILGLGPRPNLVVSAKDPMMPPGEDERRRHEQDLNRRQAAGNAGGAIVTNGAYEYTPINQPPADLAGKDLAVYDRDCLCTIFGVPPTFFTTDTNLANLEAADEQHARNAVEPRCDTIAEVLTVLVRRFDPRLFCRFDPAIQEDSESKEKVISMRLASGRTTINQENEEERWPPVEWGDEPWLPATLKQPSMMKAEHEMGLETAQAGVESQRKRDDFELQDGPAGAEEGSVEGQRRALWRRLERLRAEMKEAVA